MHECMSGVNECMNHGIDIYSQGYTTSLYACVSCMLVVSCMHA